jgi:hypothetical protein
MIRLSQVPTATLRNGRRLAGAVVPTTQLRVGPQVPVLLLLIPFLFGGSHMERNHAMRWKAVASPICKFIYAGLPAL